MLLTGQGSCPGSFGEILQGVLEGNRKFLINLKIKNSSHVRLTLSPSLYSSEKEAEFANSYRAFAKSYKVIRNILGDVGRHEDYLLDVRSDIPIGKGCASSTADMVASIQALSSALSLALKPDYISRMITEIEPNDGIHFPGTAIYHHTSGELIGQYDYIPAWKILAVDFGGTVDTVKFNLQPIVLPPERTSWYETLLQDAKACLHAKDSTGLASIATRSAELWQAVNPKPGFDAATRFAREQGGIGLLNTHSGTYLGILYEDGVLSSDRLLQSAQSAFPGCGVRWFETVTCR